MCNTSIHMVGPCCMPARHTAEFCFRRGHRRSFTLSLALPPLPAPAPPHSPVPALAVRFQPLHCPPSQLLPGQGQSLLQGGMRSFSEHLTLPILVKSSLCWNLTSPATAGNHSGERALYWVFSSPFTCLLIYKMRIVFRTSQNCLVQRK